KKFGGEAVLAGNILVRQRGTKFWAGDNVGLGRDHTLFATATGAVQFTTKRDIRTYVNVIMADTTDTKQATRLSPVRPRADPDRRPHAGSPDSRAPRFSFGP